MRATFLATSESMEAAFRRLEGQVPPPRWVKVHEDWTWRYEERTAQQAIIQKLARYISGLCATDALLTAGFVQEQMALQRTLDEIGEDIIFLSLGVIRNEITPLHTRYLREFWAEEFDHPDPVKSTQKRGMVRRASIRSYLASVSPMADTHAWHTASHTVYRTFSGHLHAASPQIMDMVGGHEAAFPRFHVRGMMGTPRVREAILSAWNFFLRGFLALSIAAKAFGDAKLVDALAQAMKRFESTDPGTQ